MLLLRSQVIDAMPNASAALLLVALHSQVIGSLSRSHGVSDDTLHSQVNKGHLAVAFSLSQADIGNGHPSIAASRQKERRP